METICGQTGNCGLMSLWCFIYDFQTLLTGAAAIIVAVFAGIPVWRQLKDTNLQTRISHRETLAALLRDALRRYARVQKSLKEPLSAASRATSYPDGEPIEIDPHDAHHLEQMLHGVLDWYLVVLADTEHADIEAKKTELKDALTKLGYTLNDAHWADHNDQTDEDRDTPDDEWARIVARCAEAKIEAAERVGQAEAAYRALCGAQEAWIQSLRSQLARLDRQITSAA